MRESFIYFIWTYLTFLCYSGACEDKVTAAIPITPASWQTCLDQRANVSVWREGDTLMKYSIKRPHSIIKGDRDFQKGVFTSLHREIFFGSSKNLSVKGIKNNILKNLFPLLRTFHECYRFFMKPYLVQFDCVCMCLCTCFSGTSLLALCYIFNDF